MNMDAVWVIAAVVMTALWGLVGLVGLAVQRRGRR
jgi:hypothetical protein